MDENKEYVSKEICKIKHEGTEKTFVEIKSILARVEGRLNWFYITLIFVLVAQFVLDKLGK